MTALVTGAAGFIGSTLVRMLAEAGTDVIGIDNLDPYYDVEWKRRNLRAVAGDRFRFHQADLLTGPLSDLLDGVDVVYHLAGRPGVRGSWGNEFRLYSSANIDATQRLLEAVRDAPSRPRVVYASSSSVYGDAETYPTHELLLPRPRSPYGVTKLAAEHLCRLYAANFDVHTISLRFFTVYGPGQRPDMAFTRFLTAALEGTEIPLYGSGEQVRDFTYVDDVVRAVIRAGRGDTPSGRVYNVAGGGAHSVNEVLGMVAELSGSQLLIDRRPVSQGDVMRTSADTAAITAALGWSPSVPLRDGLTRQLEWIAGSLLEAKSGR